jgi:hypothetical protein
MKSSTNRYQTPAIRNKVFIQSRQKGSAQEYQKQDRLEKGRIPVLKKAK